MMAGLDDPATLAEAKRRFAAMDTDPGSSASIIADLDLVIVAHSADETT